MSSAKLTLCAKGSHLLSGLVALESLCRAEKTCVSLLSCCMFSVFYSRLGTLTIIDSLMVKNLMDYIGHNLFFFCIPFFVVKLNGV